MLKKMLNRKPQQTKKTVRVKTWVVYKLVNNQPEIWGKFNNIDSAINEARRIGGEVDYGF